MVPVAPRASAHMAAEPSVDVTLKPSSRSAFESRPLPQPQSRTWPPGGSIDTNASRASAIDTPTVPSTNEAAFES